MGFSQLAVHGVKRIEARTNLLDVELFQRTATLSLKFHQSEGAAEDRVTLSVYADESLFARFEQIAKLISALFPSDLQEK